MCFADAQAGFVERTESMPAWPRNAQAAVKAIALIGLALPGCNGGTAGVPVTPIDAGLVRDSRVDTVASLPDFFVRDVPRPDASPGSLRLKLITAPVAELPSRVTIGFTVETNTGDPVPGLLEPNFEISEDAEPLSVSESQLRILPTPRGIAFFAVILLDLSGSVRAELPRLQSAAQGLIAALPSNLSVAIYTFDGRREIQERLAFTQNRTAMQAAIDGLASVPAVDPSTNLYGAVVEGINVINTRRQSALGSGAAVSGFLVTFTDGTDRAGLRSATEARLAVRTARGEPFNYAAFTIGLGNEINRGELATLGPDGFEFADDATRLNAAFAAIGQRLDALSRHYYVLSYCSPKRAGSHRLTIRASQGGLSGRLTSNFSAANFRGGCVP